MTIFLRPSRIVAFVSAAALAASAVGCNRQPLSDPKADPAVVASMRSIDVGGAAGGAAKKITTWGKVTGRFVYNGNPPPAKNNTGFIAGKDALCAVQSMPDDTLVVDSSTKGISNVVIFLTGVKDYKHPAYVHPDILAAPKKDVIFDQKQCRFLDHVSGVNFKNDNWFVVNSDATGHNADGKPGNGNDNFNPVLPAGGSRFQYTFKYPVFMPFPITCSIHPWMKAFVVARPDPYFAVTGKDGSFTIENLPAGVELEFQVWHEKADKGLNARPDWKKGRTKITIANDGDTVALGDILVDPALLP
jgi:hypothetical protein